MSSGKAFPSKEESHFLNCINEHCEKAYCVHLRDHSSLMKAKEQKYVAVVQKLEERTRKLLYAEADVKRLRAAIGQFLYGYSRNEGWKTPAVIELEEALAGCKE